MPVQPPRRYLLMLAATMAAALAVRLAIGVWFDPFADFYFLTGLHTAPQSTVDQHTERKVKRRMIEDAAPGSIDAAIIGNSRAAVLDPTEGSFGRQYPDAVNLSFSGAKPLDMAALADVLRRRHPAAKLFVALDFDSCFGGWSETGLYVDPALDGEARMDAVTRLMSMTSLVRWGRMILSNLSVPQQLMPRGNIVRGMPSPADLAARITFDRALYTIHFDPREFRSNCAEAAHLFIAAHPDTIVFVPPLSAEFREILSKTGAAEFLTPWRRDLAGLARPILDFSCSAEVAAGSYLDAHHYGPDIASRILDDLNAWATGHPTRWACILD